MAINILRIIRSFIAVVGMIVLLAGIALEIIPVFSNGTDEVVNALHLTNQQYALDERISKDVLILAYRPESEHASAILELQVTLPVFEKNQAILGAGLQTNDPSLQLPQHIPGDVALLIIQSQSDYAALDSAAKSILKNAGMPIDQNQLAIMQQHERPYFIQMNTISKVWQQHILQIALTFFQVELGFGIALLVLVIVYWVLDKVAKRINKEN